VWGAHIGAQKLGYSFFNVPPGKAAFPYHTTAANEEMIYIIDGAGVLRFGRKRLRSPRERSSRVRRRGVSAPAYQHGRKRLRTWLSVTMEFPDICEYPDSNKVGAYATAAVGQQVGLRALYVKDKNVDYYEGEDGKEIERVKRSCAKA